MAKKVGVSTYGRKLTRKDYEQDEKDWSKMMKVRNNLKNTKNFADYLDKNPQISEESNLFSGSQAHKELQILAGDTGMATPKYKHVKSLMNGLSKQGVYNDEVATGKAKKPTALNKSQIKGRLVATDNYVYGAHKDFKKYHTFEALNTMRNPVNSTRHNVFQPHESTNEKEYKNRSGFNKTQSHKLTKNQILAAKRSQGRQR